MENSISHIEFGEKIFASDEAEYNGTNEIHFSFSDLDDSHNVFELCRWMEAENSIRSIKNKVVVTIFFDTEKFKIKQDLNKFIVKRRNQ